MLSRRLLLAAAAVAGLALAGCAKGGASGPAEGDMSMGDPNAPVKMVEYASMSCSHCAQFNNEVFPAFKAKYIDTGKVHYTLKEFLTPPEQVATAGFLLARCAGKDKYFSVVDAIFHNQAEMFQTGDATGVRTVLLRIAQSAGLTEEQLLLTEPLAVMVRAVARAEVKPGATAAVVGAGTLGLLGLQVLRARGARVLVVGRTDRRLNLARQLGAEAVHALAAGPGSEAARAFSGREGVDVVVETAGTPEAVAGAIELARPGGRVVLTGLPHEPSQVHFFWVVRHELTLVGSMIYQDEFPEAMRLLHDGAVTVAPLVTHRFPLDAIGDAFVAYRQPDSIKIAVIP